MQILLVFAKEPIPGKVKTRLAAHIGAWSACVLYRAFLRDVAASLARLTDAAAGDGEAIEIVWAVDGEPRQVLPELHPELRGRWQWRRQATGDLGRRLRLAFRSAFAAGADTVAVIGTDCPHLASGQIRSVFTGLADGFDACLLPAEDGGYACLGLARYSEAAFRGIPWSSPAVGGTTLRRLREAGLRCHELPPVFDVDTVAELQRLDERLRADPELAPHSAAALERLWSRETEGRG